MLLNGGLLSIAFSQPKEWQVAVVMFKLPLQSQTPAAPN